MTNEKALSLMNDYIKTNINSEKFKHYIYLMRDYGDVFWFTILDTRYTPDQYSCMVGCCYILDKYSGEIKEDPCDFYAHGRPIPPIIYENDNR